MEPFSKEELLATTKRLRSDYLTNLPDPKTFSARYDKQDYADLLRCYQMAYHWRMDAPDEVRLPEIELTYEPYLVAERLIAASYEADALVQKIEFMQALTRIYFASIHSEIAQLPPFYIRYKSKTMKVRQLPNGNFLILGKRYKTFWDFVSAWNPL